MFMFIYGTQKKSKKGEEIRGSVKVLKDTQQEVRKEEKKDLDKII